MQGCVGDHMRRATDVILHPDHSVREALFRMREKGLKFAPVVDGDVLVGIFSVSRLASFPRKSSHDRERLAVRDRMRSTVPFLYETDPASLGEAIAAKTGIRRFCVVTQDHALIGTFEAADHATTTPVPEETLRSRLAHTPTRAVPSAPGDVGAYADHPKLRVRDIGNGSRE